MDRIMQEYWQSSLDATGHIMGASTCYGILTHIDDRYKYDFEQTARFYKTNNVEEVRPHRLNFAVVRQSMQIRFFIEMIIYGTLACVFQYFITKFSQEFNVMY